MRAAGRASQAAAMQTTARLRRLSWAPAVMGVVVSALVSVLAVGCGDDAAQAGGGSSIASGGGGAGAEGGASTAAWPNGGFGGQGENVAPVAAAGADADVAPGALVTLDGSGSYDANG